MSSPLHVKIHLLQRAVASLPVHLPLSSSEYSLHLDQEIVEEESPYCALNQALHSAWGYKADGLVINERGRKIEQTVDLISSTAPVISGADMALVELWVDALLDAAYAAGAQKPTLQGSNSRFMHSITGQSRLQFVVLSKEEAAVQTSCEIAALRATASRRQEAEARAKEKRVEERRERDTFRKKRQRERKRLERAREEMAVSANDLIDLSVSDDERDSDTAERDAYAFKQSMAKHVSTGKTTEKNRKNTAKKRSVDVDTIHRNMHWQNFWFWEKIVRQSLGEFSAARIEKWLHLLYPELFAGKGGLMKGTIQKWFWREGGKNIGWTDSTLQRAAIGCRTGVVSRCKALDKYPAIVEGAESQLLALRAGGLAVQGPLIRTVVHAHVMLHAPHLLGIFKLSDSWVHWFARDHMGWSERAATRRAKKVPENANELCTLAHHRIAFTMTFNNVHPALCVNADQSGIHLVPNGKWTYEKRGATDVPLVSHDEKRQFTVVIASLMDGDILPIQSIWGGSTDESLPARATERYEEADVAGFTYGHGDTRHWSFLATTVAQHIGPKATIAYS